MGIRADFYCMDDEYGFYSDSWVGSVAYGGDPKNFNQELLNATSYQDFLDEVHKELKGRDDAYGPLSEGDKQWPWTWKDSQSTDFSFVFSYTEKKVLLYNFGRGPVSIEDFLFCDQIIWETLPKKTFPEMNPSDHQLSGT